MTRVKVSKRNRDTAPKSLRVYSAVSSPPAAAAGHSSGAVVRRKERSGPSPSVRATSSNAGSTWDSTAATGSTTYGRLTRLRTIHAGKNPRIPGNAASQV